RGRKLDSRSLQLLTRQLASLVASGLPVDEALTLAAKQQRKPAISTLLLDVRSRVVEGRSLAQALAAHPRAFDNMFQSMVKAGESSGFLGAVLNRLADYCESSQHTRQKVQMALVYPLALLGVSMLVVALLMVFVVPRLVGIFSQAGRELPLLTRMLIAVSEFFSSGMALVATAVLLIVVLLCRQWLQQEDKRLRWHSLLLRMPLFGALITESECARFSATLSILLGSGVPLLEALHIATRVLDNRVLRQAAGKVTVAVREGSSLGAALEKGRVFPPLMVHMVASGEANGSLGEQLDHVARHQEKELELLLGTTVALLEPLTILFMGGLVTLIMLAILLPIFDINKFV
ncbi:MAG TPA: type II secretion system protein GspF, partial [Pseudomonadaceae bacterium]|nr:type II secretion system protein GspF [Pseudomonadaceae bacterium]